MSHIAPIPSPDPAAETALDAHGHDPAAYDWVPVLKKRRKDGWSPDKQRAFIEALADSGSVVTAAQSVGMSESSAYRLRRSPGAEAFDRAWSAAIDAASKKLLDAAFERALVGTDEPVFDRDGNRVGRRLRQSDRLLMFLLRAYGPDCFRDAASHRTNPAPAAVPVAEALIHLHPAPPPAPEALMAPDDLAVALEVADLCDGALPHWYRDAPDEADPVPAASPLSRDPDEAELS
ncbi:MAG TPA: hypothetical protein PKD48_02205 [Sphingopyxis sp.]|nr:hypothetical protein [Sphingopyxis sp.]